MTMKVGVLKGFLDDKPSCERARGFTVFETMIVLSITTILFVIIAATLSGRQNAAEFIRAIQTAQADIQQVIDQETAGYFPQQTFSCTASASGPSFSAGANAQGTNEPCVFLGKVIQFGMPRASKADNEQFQILTVAGLRSGAAGAGSPFSGTKPAVVNVGNDYASYSIARTLQYGLHVLWVKPVGGNPIGAVGFLMEPGSADSTSNNGYQSGTQQVDLVPVPNTAINQPLLTAATAINTGLNDVNLSVDAPINPAQGVQVCLVSGGTNQSGLITIGQSGRKLHVALDIRSNQTCS